jgi:hypothetical protein
MKIFIYLSDNEIYKYFFYLEYELSFQQIFGNKKPEWPFGTFGF